MTIGKESYPLPSPFFVMASQNPIENEGVYTLPEAAVDRFLFKVVMGYPEKKYEERIIEENITLKEFGDFHLKPILNAKKILDVQQLVHQIYVDPKIKEYILEIVTRTRTKEFRYGSYLEYGGSPRASISLYIASKAWALLNGRNYVIPSDVKAVTPSVLRHRLILSYRARAENLSSDTIIEDLLKTVRAP